MFIRNDDEWSEEDAALRITEKTWEALAPGVLCQRYPGNEPVRKILTGRRNRKVGGFYSFKMKRHIAHESEHECRLAKIFELDPNVIAYWGQPEKLKIALDGDEITPDGRDRMIYTPDFLTMIGGQAVRFEFKLWSDIRPEPPKRPGDERAKILCEEAKATRRRLRIARQAYRLSGLAWFCLTELELEAMADEQTVGDIVANGGREIDPDDLARLLDALSKAPGKSLALGECEQMIQKSDSPRGAILARIPERLLHVDLTDTITSQSTIRLVEDAHAR